MIDERIIWLVPFLLYLIDCICYVDNEHIIIFENYRFQWLAQFFAVPFVFRGRHIYFIPFWLPYIFAFRLRWQIVDRGSERKINRLRRKLVIWRSKFYEFRILAVLAWINLFVIGPILTIFGGLIFSVRYVIPIHFGILIACITLIIFHSRSLKYDVHMIVTHSLELILSPGYLPNVCRRLSLHFVCDDVDGVKFVKRYGQRSSVETLINAVEFRLSEMKLELGDDLNMLRKLEEYSEEIRI